MAHCIRRPVLLSAGLRSFGCLQQRPFSIFASQWAGPGRRSRNMNVVEARPQSERSLKGLASEFGQLPSDLGLLPETFIYPSRTNRPKLSEKPLSAIAKFQWTWLKRRMQGMLSLLLYKFSSKPRLKLQPRQTAAAAVALHQRMYTAFAQRDVDLLDQICTEGLRESFRARIANRPKGERWEWEIGKYTKRAKVMSHRALPASALGIEGRGLRQGVVRICSRQKLTRYKSDGTIVPGSAIEKDTTEYLVIQRTLENSVEQDWMVWGMTEETTLEELEYEEMSNSPR